MSLQQPIYRYAHLPYNSIRLLRLLPHEDENAPIRCQLFDCTLENSRGTRPYEALSYVWGSDYKPESVLIDSYSLSIGENLFAALLHLRDRSIERILWIDAICINQHDTKEKGHQVQSMAKIYATATRVIVWLGKATPDIDQSLEVIRIAGFTSKETTIAKRSENAILEIVKAPWFQRIWVLQEVAAARHILVKCGHAEIDGYAFFEGLRVLELPQEGLWLPVLTVGYLARGATFRSRCAAGQAGRFSLDISPLAQLVDMFHGRQASDRRDKIYALLGMSSDDPSNSGLLANYDTSWATVFQQFIKSVLRGALSVDTWDNSELAVIRIKGCVLGKVSSFPSNVDAEGKRVVEVEWKHESLNQWKLSYLNFPPSTEVAMAGDAICLLEGAKFTTIIRLCKDYWKIITITAPLPVDPNGVGDDGLLDDFSLPAIKIFPHNFLLVWDWDTGENQSQRGYSYEALISRVALTTPEPGLQNDLDRVARYWNSGMAMRSLNRRKADRNLGYALSNLEDILEERISKGLTDLDQSHNTKRGDTDSLQGIISLLLEGEGGRIALCMAAGEWYEAVVRLLLGTGKVDPDAPDVDKQTPLWRAAKSGNSNIVKLLLDTCNVDPDAGRHQPGHDEAANGNRTPLSLAAEYGYEAIAKLLIDTGNVDLNAWNLGRYRTPLMYAAQNGHLGIVKLLLNTGEVNLDHSGEIHSSQGEELMLAVRGGHKETAELLIGDSKMSYSEYGYWCETLSWAVRTGHDDIAELLRRWMDKGL
ncbi:ACB 4-hydroxyacetophenone monooxygenase [Fusarium napiforme]|uniref:ACB 4-hydroxyacetophenone monooxygenase n=1 Tax=Fusarium napiforme TaxID=42672 RepID=A0A8H5JFL4_9HYPO|nr:ACB 4-hydroxyacetophenone monooxygenase [Fusarium napiforme]